MKMTAVILRALEEKKNMTKHLKLVAMLLGIFAGAFTGSRAVSKAAAESPVVESVAAERGVTERVLSESVVGESVGVEGVGADGVRSVVSHALPEMDGKHLEVKAVEVSYSPGGASGSHSHPCAVIAYVAEGSIRSQVNDEPAAVYKQGEAFYEAPNGVHRISANASQTEPAKLLAFFICDHATPLTVAAPDSKNPKHE